MDSSTGYDQLLYILIFKLSELNINHNNSSVCYKYKLLLKGTIRCAFKVELWSV